MEGLLDAGFAAGRLSDANMFIYALLKKEKGELRTTAEVLGRVLNQTPVFWSAWVELCRLLVDMDSPESFNVLGKLDGHWAKNFFTAHLLAENIRIHDKFELFCYNICHSLLAFFNESTHLLNLLATLFHNISDYENSAEFFARILALDPFRCESTDVLSNILYVKEQQNELGRLAISCFDNDRYTPETCCVLGNYYSLIGEHLKAAQYFKRAIALDRNFLAAYTLLGHEYLELKNVSSAIEAYNVCVQINRRDFRAWYGLGQAYELQSFMHFAIYYFLQALAANPRDSRMWNAVGNCYEKIGKRGEAAKCFEKSESLKDQEGISLAQLGKLYDMMNFKKKAAKCFEENLKKKDNLRMVDREMAETLLYLTNYFKAEGDFDKAMAYATRLLDFSGVEKQEAQNIIYELNAHKY